MDGNLELGFMTSTRNVSAVVLSGVEVFYKKDHLVLSGMDMNVAIGKIYCLLGSSGCGKTTVLSCILGQRKHEAGEIRVFNEKPGKLGYGRNVGYMPQEISLFREFSIKETLSYFGELVGLDGYELNMRIKLMTELMDFPECSTVIGSLSGGQQRRVSLATALLHDPKLLVLDEPTVGVDPLLRQRIWQHMRMLVETKKTTVIITSHYIEECRQADMIGVIRHGRLIIETTPAQLFHDFDCDNLESIILSVCRGDQLACTNEKTSGMKQSKYFAQRMENDFPSTLPTKSKGHGHSMTESLKRVRVLCKKNLVVFARMPIMLIVAALTPTFYIMVINLTFGNNPVDLGVGILNYETGNQTVCESEMESSYECSGQLLSCQFLRSIPQENFNMIWFQNEEDANKAVKIGSTWGYLIFERNFSEHLVDRMTVDFKEFVGSFKNAQILARLDESNTPISMAITMMLYKAFEDFMTLLLSECGFDSRQAELPLKYQPPIFGTRDMGITEYIVGGSIAGILLMYGCFSTSFRLITEKKSGILSRSLVCGVKLWEMLLAHLMMELIPAVIQSGFSYFTITTLLGIQIHGSHWLILLIFMLTAYQGIVIGYLMGTMLKEEFTSFVINISIFLPVLYISGGWWPVEGMTPLLQYISPFSPCALSGEAIRSVVSRGWGFLHPNVWPGIIAPVAYIVAFLILTFISNKNSQ